MQYFMFQGTEDGGRITMLTKEEVIKLAQDLSNGDYGDFGEIEFMLKYPAEKSGLYGSSDPNYWGKKVLLIRGEIVVPKPKVTETIVVKEWEV